MKTIFKTLLILALGSTLSYAAAFQKDAKFRSTKVHIVSQKPLTKGANTLELFIKKGTKKITDDVVVKAFMPAMPGMPAMESKAKAENLGNGHYKVKLNLPMHGTWQLHIFILPEKGRKSRVKTSITF